LKIPTSQAKKSLSAWKRNASRSRLPLNRKEELKELQQSPLLGLPTRKRRRRPRKKLKKKPQQRKRLKNSYPLRKLSLKKKRLNYRDKRKKLTERRGKLSTLTIVQLISTKSSWAVMETSTLMMLLWPLYLRVTR
jgi:hypothetical protein